MSASFWRVSYPEAWAEPPKLFSFSTLRGIETCPLQWALRKARYRLEGELRTGYPQRGALPRLVGQILHLAVETIVRTPVLDGQPSGVAQRLRTLGGLTVVLQRSQDAVLNDLEGNPRVAPLLPYLRTSLQQELPRLRPKLQTLLANLPAWSTPTKAVLLVGASALRRPVRSGTHSEVMLISEELSWKGVADLVTIEPSGCHILDFKTGKQKDEHDLQLQVYGLLWGQDHVANPSTSGVARLTVRYDSIDRPVEPMSATQLGLLSEEIQRRTKMARSVVASAPPPAVPSTEACSWCDVRHLCNSYWSEPVISSVRPESALSDAEVEVGDRLAGSSYEARVVVSDRIPKGTSVVLRASPTHGHFGQVVLSGARVRLLDAYLQISAVPNEPITLFLGNTGEVFAVID